MLNKLTTVMRANNKLTTIVMCAPLSFKKARNSKFKMAHLQRGHQSRGTFPNINTIVSIDFRIPIAFLMRAAQCHNVVTEKFIYFELKKFLSCEYAKKFFTNFIKT